MAMRQCDVVDGVVVDRDGLCATIGGIRVVKRV
jgi:hypothetical protein